MTDENVIADAEAAPLPSLFKISGRAGDLVGQLQIVELALRGPSGARWCRHAG